MATEVTKRCTKCGKEKPISGFYRTKKSADGRMSHCIECDKKKGRAYYLANKDAINAKNIANKRANPEQTARQNAEWHQRNRPRRQAMAAAWRLANPEKSRAYSRKHDRANPDKARERNRRRLQTAKGKVENTVRSGMLKGLKAGGKKGKKSFEALGYTPDDLMAHLESLFLPGMTWVNHGRGTDCWHIDHIRPLASFDYETVDDPQFRQAWALSNLQPLWEIENLSKNAKWTPPPPAANDNDLPSLVTGTP